MEFASPLPHRAVIVDVVDEPDKRTVGEKALDDYMNIVREGELELIRFSGLSAAALTNFAIAASKNEHVLEALDNALASMPEGFLALCHRLEAAPSEFFETLAAYRKKRLAAERSTEAPVSSPGTSQPQ